MLTQKDLALGQGVRANQACSPSSRPDSIEIGFSLALNRFYTGRVRRIVLADHPLPACSGWRRYHRQTNIQPDHSMGPVTTGGD